MHAATEAMPLVSRSTIWCRIATWIAYPLFLIGEGYHRRFLNAASGSAPLARPSRSASAEAYQQACIAISYAFMARSMLHKFGQQSRPERRS